MPLFVGDALMAHAKGSCYRCGRGDSLVDMDVQIEGEGALAICSHCIGDAAEAAGLHLNAAAVAEMQAAFIEERRQFEPERIAALEAEIAKQEDTIRIAEGVIESLERSLASAAQALTAPKPARK